MKLIYYVKELNKLGQRRTRNAKMKGRHVQAAKYPLVTFKQLNKNAARIDRQADANNSLGL